jgi:acyl-CoA dehydrogenase
MTEEERQALHDVVVSACGAPDAAGWHPEIWRDLDRMGMTALSVPEAIGGGGADLAAATAVLIALGYAGASVPAVETGLMAGWLMESAGARLPAGVVTAAAGEALELRSEGNQWRVTGTLPRVAWARQADSAVVLARAESSPCVLVLPLADAELRHGLNVAGEPRDDVVLSATAVPREHLYRLGGSGPQALGLLRRAAFGRSAMMAGAAHGVYAYAARYVRERRQFGRPLSALQAVQQLLAELATEAGAMTVAAEYAAAAVTIDPAASWTLEAARIRVAAGAGKVGAIGHQILGAIGFTDEHPLHRLTRRLWAWREEYGNHATWSDRLGSELAGNDLPSLWQLIAG